MDYEQTKDIALFASVLKLVAVPNVHHLAIRDSAIVTTLITEILLNLTDYKEIFKSEKEKHFLIDFVKQDKKSSLANIILYVIA